MQRAARQRRRVDARAGQRCRIRRLRARPSACCRCVRASEHSVAATKSMIAGLVAGAASSRPGRRDAALARGARRLPDVAARARRAAAAGRWSNSGRRRKIRLRARARRDFRDRRRGRAEAEGNLRASTPKRFPRPRCCMARPSSSAPGFLVIAFMPQDEAREGMDETLRAARRDGRARVADRRGRRDADRSARRRRDRPRACWRRSR